MIKKVVSIAVIMAILLVPSIKANAIPANSSVYKEGIYKFDNLNSYQSITVELIDQNQTNFLVFDENYNIKVSYKLDYNSKLKIAIKPNYTIVIVGDGEIAISFIKKE